MEPLNENELNRLLQQWKAPNAPKNLKPPGTRPWWNWLFTGTIRVPVPVGVAIVLALAVWIYSRESSSKPAIQAPAARPVSIADFQPVKELQPRVIGRANEGN